jgi:hypothetical protein
MHHAILLLFQFFRRQGDALAERRSLFPGDALGDHPHVLDAVFVGPTGSHGVSHRFGRRRVDDNGLDMGMIGSTTTGDFSTTVQGEPVANVLLVGIKGGDDHDRLHRRRRRWRGWINGRIVCEGRPVDLCCAWCNDLGHALSGMN